MCFEWRRGGLPPENGALESGMRMLDAFIIEEIKRREAEREKLERQRPKLEIPRREREDQEDASRDEAAEKPQRGVVVIDL